MPDETPRPKLDKNKMLQSAAGGAVPGTILLGRLREILGLPPLSPEGGMPPFGADASRTPALVSASSERALGKRKALEDAVEDPRVAQQSRVYPQTSVAGPESYPSTFTAEYYHDINQNPALQSAAPPPGEQCYPTAHLQNIEKGVCAILTARILKESFTSDIGVPPLFIKDSRTLGSEQLALEERRNNSIEEDLGTDIETDLFPYYGLEAEGTQIDTRFSNDNLTDIFAECCQSSTRMYFSLSSSTDINIDGHAICIVTHSKGGHFFFDANRGMYRSTNAEEFAGNSIKYMLETYPAYDIIDSYHLQEKTLS